MEQPYVGEGAKHRLGTAAARAEQAAARPVEVRPVRTRAELRAFIRLPDACQRRGMPRAETGWILEVNEPMNRAMEALTGRIVKRYRIYERLLEADAPPSVPG